MNLTTTTKQTNKHIHTHARRNNKIAFHARQSDGFEKTHAHTHEKKMKNGIIYNEMEKKEDEKSIRIGEERIEMMKRMKMRKKNNLSLE